MQGAFLRKAFWYVDFFYLFNWIGSVLRWTENGSFYRCLLYLFCNIRAIYGNQHLFSWLVFFISKIIIPFPALREGHIAENQVLWSPQRSAIVVWIKYMSSAEITKEFSYLFCKIRPVDRKPFFIKSSLDFSGSGIAVGNPDCVCICPARVCYYI